MVETKKYSDGTVATGKSPLPYLSPSQQEVSDAMKNIDDIESLAGGSNGPSIKLRDFIKKIVNERDELRNEVDDLNSLIAVFQSGVTSNAKLTSGAHTAPETE